MLEIPQLLKSLSHHRAVFHSEADFQHALAWEIHTRYPEAGVRLEFPVALGSNVIYVDIWIMLDGEVVAIELKYKTRGLSVDVNGERFRLKNQSAQDVGRYDFLKDIQRLESIASVSQNPSTAYAVFLTNDSAYWKPPHRPKTVDADFRIHKGRLVTGVLSWKNNASDGTMKNRENNIVLKGKYCFHWRHYSRFNGLRYGEFRTLVVSPTT